jgi:hypothetical protein
MSSGMIIHARRAFFGSGVKGMDGYICRPSEVLVSQISCHAMPFSPNHEALQIFYQRASADAYKSGVLGIVEY